MKYLKIRIHWLILASFAGSSPAIIQAQMISGEEVIEGVVLSDPRIEELTERYNRSYEIQGYRIQIISSSKKELTKKSRSLFISMYQGYKAYEIYQQPFFIVKVGDFLTKLEAEKFHREIKDEFQESYIVPDVIQPFDQYTRKDVE